MTLTPHFKEIRLNILKALEKANKSISVAVCWFTNEELFNLLCSKLTQGVKVELIILDDYINSNPFGCNFQDFISKGGNLYLSAVSNPMHNKYCIIDNEILINGSYNWTYFAETKNEENIIIFENCKELIQSFKIDFNRLKTINKKIDLYIPKPLLDYEKRNKENKSRNVFGSFNFLSNDLFLKAIETDNKLFYDAAKSIVPDNIIFQKKGVELQWENSIIFKSTLSESVKNDRICVIFPKGTSVPASSTANYTTVVDNQKSMDVNLLIGESDRASKNIQLRNYKLDGIPPLKAGEASIKAEYQISLDGNLQIIKHIHDTGLIDVRNFNLASSNIFIQE